MLTPADERRHEEAAVEEWVFECWTDSIGAVHGQRLVGDHLWYWTAICRPGRPVLLVSDWAVPRRGDPFLVKGDGLWAEITCDDPFRQWSVANEMYATALADSDEALGRGFGETTAISVDWEWYAAADVVEVDGGYVQDGRVDGLFEIEGERRIRHDDLVARRWHRWGGAVPVMPPVELDAAAAVAARAPFRFPDGTVVEWRLTGNTFGPAPRDVV